MDDRAGAIPADAVVGRVALTVGDLDRTVTFYEAVVGLGVQRRTNDRAVLGVGGDALLELIEAPSVPERTDDEAGLFHAAFRVPSRAALGDALRRIEDQSRLDGASDHLVSEALYLSDPEGNGVEIYFDRPRTEWPQDEDGRVQMDTRPLELDAIRECGHGASDAPAGTTVGHVHLEVTSLPAARRFYAEALGLRVRQAYGSSALFLAAGDYHHHVGVNTWNRRTEPAEGRDLAWFELVLPDDDALAATRRRLESHGVATTDLDGGFEATDSDGIRVRVVAR